MRRNPIFNPALVIAFLILQIVPLVLFPLKFFAATSQVWWLPILLAVMVLIADFQLIVRRSPIAWPWYLLAFAQGFNIISRLMMLWPNASVISGNDTFVNWPYLILTFISMGLSAFMLWYTEKPQVRVALLQV
jgi:hypothetical protein